MMKKLLSILLVAGMLMLSAGSTFGETYDPNREVSTYVVTNLVATTGLTGGGTVVPEATIRSRDRILGFQLTALNSRVHGAGISLYDTTSVLLATTTTLFAEAEVSKESPTLTVWFPYPKKLTNQLVIRGGDTAYVLTIYYEDV